MTGRITTALGVVFALLIVLIVWRLFSEGVFEAEEALAERAESLDGGALDEWPFVDGGVVDGGVVDGGQADADAVDGGPGEDGAEDYPSLGIEGVVRVGVHHLSITDKQGRNVLRVRSARTGMHLASMHEGTFRITEGHIKGAHIALYRDGEGKISLADALRTQDPSVQQSLAMPPQKEPDGGQWAMEVGPIVVEHSVLTLGFTAKPVKFRIDHAIIRVKQKHDEQKPRIYFDRIRGAMLEPSPLPKPIPIAFAKGIVRLEGRPMVELAARTCVGASELRVRAVVPARKKPVELTGDSVGLGGALGKMGLTIAAKKKSEKIQYHEGAVKIEGGPSCTDL
jgi:hypothetical protein